MEIVGLKDEYLQGLRNAMKRRRDLAPLLVLFLGSTIGNFERQEALYFLSSIRELLCPGDGLLLAADLMKSEQQLAAAYDDPLGITAAFNLNLLARLNREFGAGFNLSQFRHEARFNKKTRAIEMHLRSLERQAISIPGIDLNLFLQAGETIWTESSA